MKKIILSAFFAAALLSNVILIPSVSAAETEYFNCSKETLVSPETAENTCFRLYPSLPTVKRLAPDSKCNNTGWTNGNVCCCESKIDYNCSWREVKTTTTCAGPGQCVTSSSGGCLSGESKGGDCNAGVRPKDGTTKTYDCCCPAATYTTQKAKFTMPDWQVPIDTITLSEAKCTGPDNSGECEIPWIAEYIQGMYKYGLGIGGILAAIVLMAGGVLWLVSAGDVSKITQAKDLIIGSITGLMILMGSYILLSQINPELTNLRSISVRMIEQILLEPIENGSDSTDNISNNCADDGGLENIKDIVATNAKTPMLSTIGREGLVKAIEEAKKRGVELYVTSAFRTAAHQQSLWDAAVTKYGSETTAAKYVARPGSCGGHRSGQAIDVCIKGTISCQKMGSAAVASYSDNDVLKLIEIMRAAGWQRYCGEWWHFQYKDTPKNSCP